MADSPKDRLKVFNPESREAQPSTEHIDHLVSQKIADRIADYEFRIALLTNRAEAAEEQAAKSRTAVSDALLLLGLRKLSASRLRRDPCF